MKFKKNKQNKVVNETDELINKFNDLNTKLFSLQRERDLKTKNIDNEYGNKIDAILREIDFVKMQMDQAKEYANKNLQGIYQGAQNED